MPIRRDFTDRPTVELFSPVVLLSTGCADHGKGIGQYCHDYEGLVRNRVRGICNKRAIKAGMNGPITPSSLDRTIPKGRRA